MERTLGENWRQSIEDMFRMAIGTERAKGLIVFRISQIESVCVRLLV